MNRSIPKTLCAGCDKHFASNTEFDAHRAGSYVPSTRRCMLTSEMLSAGWQANPTPVASTGSVAIHPVWFRTAERAKSLIAFGQVRKRHSGKDGLTVDVLENVGGTLQPS